MPLFDVTSLGAHVIVKDIEADSGKGALQKWFELMQAWVDPENDDIPIREVDGVVIVLNLPGEVIVRDVETDRVVTTTRDMEDTALNLHGALARYLSDPDRSAAEEECLKLARKLSYQLRKTL